MGFKIFLGFTPKNMPNVFVFVYISVNHLFNHHMGASNNNESIKSFQNRIITRVR